MGKGAFFFTSRGGRPFKKACVFNPKVGGFKRVYNILIPNEKKKKKKDKVTKKKTSQTKKKKQKKHIPIHSVEFFVHHIPGTEASTAATPQAFNPSSIARVISISPRLSGSGAKLGFAIHTKKKGQEQTPPQKQTNKQTHPPPPPLSKSKAKKPPLPQLPQLRSDKTNTFSSQYNT